MVKFAHSVFALPFAMLAAFLAGRSMPGGWPNGLQLVLVVVCMVSARSVAMTFNRLVDAQIDARNPRTASRALPAGAISPAAAAGFLLLGVVTFATACISFFLFFRNPWPMWLGGPVLLYLCGYSFTKRFTRWSHFYLGSAIAISPVAAWLAIHPASLGWPAWVLMGAITLWIAGFDIIYACQDIDVDRREGLFSLPARLGPAGALWIARFSHLVTFLLLLSLVPLASMGWLYLIGVLLMGLLLAIENSLVKPGDYSKLNLAFFTANGIGSVVLGILGILDILLGLPAVW
jgi:4-hydroxybenzoate polyprenyltransferase